MPKQTVGTMSDEEMEMLDAKLRSTDTDPERCSMKFRKKPVMIEAVQYDGSDESGATIAGWVGLAATAYRGRLSIRTLDCTMEAVRGDWIIRGVKGGFHLCRPDIFQ